MRFYTDHQLSGDDTPLVSVLIPCYNHQDFVGEAIMSVIEQSYDHIELIVIDDGSTDNSYEVIKELGDHYGFYYELQDNMGLVKTLNKAFQSCHGEYIRILASDDKYLPNSFTPMIERVSIDRAVVAVFSNGYAVRDNQFAERLYDGKLVGLLSSDSQVMLQYFLSNISRVFIQSGVFHRNLFHSIGGFDQGVKNDDWVFLIRVFDFIVSHPPYRHEYVDVDGLGYRYHGNNMSLNTREMVDMIYEVIEKFIPDKNKKTLLANAYWNAGITRLKRNDFFSAMSLLVKSQRYDLSVTRPALTIEKYLKKLKKHCH